MTLDEARTYLLSQPSAYEDFPFGPDVRVMKVGKKMFATLSTTAATTTAAKTNTAATAATADGSGRMNLKCDPNEAQILRDLFPAVLPGYHMNKQHWNTVVLDGTVPRGEIERMIDNSYNLVLASLPRREREAIAMTQGLRS